jgi:outer membrane protein assembly factor BamB
VDGGQVFVGLGNGRLGNSAEPPEQPAGAVLCLDAQTGQPLWRQDVADGVLAQPVVDARHVYFGCRDGRGYCLDRRDGRRVWEQDLGSPVVTRPALADGRVYVVTTEGRVYRLDAATGQVGRTFDVARHSRTRPRVFSSPAVVPDQDAAGPHYRIYFGTELRTAVQSAAVLYCLRDD